MWRDFFCPYIEVYLLGELKGVKTGMTAGVGLGENKRLEGFSGLWGIGRIRRIGRMWAERESVPGIAARSMDQVDRVDESRIQAFYAPCTFSVCNLIDLVKR